MELYKIIDEIKETLEFKNREYGDTPLKTQKILEVLYKTQNKDERWMRKLYDQETL